MSILKMILTIVQALLELWRNRTDPNVAKLKAAAAITKDLNNNVESFNKALVENDAKKISAHFQQLHKKAMTHMGDS